MKIVINKTRQKENFNKHVQNIIDQARLTAGNGFDRFNYPPPRGQGIHTFELIKEVEERTEDSVYGKYKDGLIVFRIRD